MLLWAICFPLITIGIEYSPHLTFAALRALLSGSVLLAMAFFLKRKLPSNAKDWLTLTVVGFGATTLAFFGMFHAAEFVAPGLATVIASSQPLMAALLAHWVVSERLTFRGQIGLTLGFFGIVLISAPKFANGEADAFQIGIAFIIISAIGITISNVAIKRIASRIDPLMAMGWQLIIGSIPLAIIAASTEDISAIRWTGEFIGSLIGLSLAGTALAYWLWYNVLKSVDLSHANAFTFLVPIFGLIMGVSFYGEQLSTVMMVGIILSLIGIYQVAKGMQMKKKPDT
jgi:drug/metabolite transporter (DMT)-like permease